MTFDLSKTELIVVKKMCAVGSNKIIANEMEISEMTVKVHVRKILKKLGLLNRTLLAVWAVRNGLDK